MATPYNAASGPANAHEPSWPYLDVDYFEALRQSFGAGFDEGWSTGYRDGWRAAQRARAAARCRVRRHRSRCGRDTLGGGA